MTHPRIALATLAASCALAGGCLMKPPQFIASQPLTGNEPVDEIVVEQDLTALEGRPTGYLQIKVQWPTEGDRTIQAFPASTTTFRLTVTAGDLAVPITATISRAPEATTGTARLTVPVGTGRTLKVEGLNASAKVVASVTLSGLAVQAGQYTPVTTALLTRVGSIAGTVVNQETGLPVSGVSVSADGMTAQTDNSGNFQLTDVTVGAQELAFSKVTFNPATQSVLVQPSVTATSDQAALVPRHWYPQVSGISTVLLDVAARSSTEAWACGSGGTLLHTTDGGATWRRTTLDSYDLNDIEFLNASTGFIVGDSGLYGTTDGGNTWTLLNSSMGGNCLAVFGDQAIKTGYGSLHSTTNGGITFTSLSHPNYMHSWGVVSDTIFFSAYAGNPNGYYKTTSGGAAWSAIGTPPLWLDGGLHHLYASDVNTCYSVGYLTDNGLDRGRVALTQDGGSSWSSVYTTPVSGQSKRLRAIGRFGTGLCAVGSQGTVAMLFSGATSWIPMPIQPTDTSNYTLNAVSFIDNATGWAVGANGKILKY